MSNMYKLDIIENTDPSMINDFKSGKINFMPYKTVGMIMCDTVRFGISPKPFIFFRLFNTSIDFNTIFDQYPVLNLHGWRNQEAHYFYGITKNNVVKIKDKLNEKLYDLETIKSLNNLEEKDLISPQDHMTSFWIDIIKRHIEVANFNRNKKKGFFERFKKDEFLFDEKTFNDYNYIEVPAERHIFSILNL